MRRETDRRAYVKPHLRKRQRLAAVTAFAEPSGSDVTPIKGGCYEAPKTK